MAEAKGVAEAERVAKHIILAKFKEEVSAEEIQQLIKGYANLVNLIPPMKSFRWGTDAAIENLTEGYTHVFESTFETTQGIAEYVAHPAHIEYSNLLAPALEKVLAMDYQSNIVQL
ncbi:hypothetical protein GH714_017659 [Hevea brasiliensis]|uniref:Stress-response A/B barrel domain-containing protein n=1 Tax=Hevea brasiliensis TaxID=3981 RepID=A0A6A6M282_HEVBR|nr:hypothetical protein GH714_017627 [Hevea brasiliensis]KAF2306406.1 hypothetical protein GH714_017659 [Hevea brasiliensis]